MRTTSISLLTTLAASTPVLAGVVLIQPNDFLPDSILVDFETGNTGPPEIPGIHFVNEGSPSNPPYFSGLASFSDAFFGEQLYVNARSSVLPDLAVEFSPPMDAVGSWIGQITHRGDDHADLVVLRLLDNSGSLIADYQLDLPSVAESPMFFGLRSDTMIARVEWIGGNTGIFAIDNLLVGEAVPEPSSIILLMVAIAGSILISATPKIPKPAKPADLCH